MKRSVTFATALLLTVFGANALAGQAGRGGAAAAEPPPPAPAPGSPAIFRANADLQAALARSIASGGAMASASIVLTDEYRGAMVRRTEPNGAIVHPGNTEVHYIVEGSGTRNDVCTSSLGNCPPPSAMRKFRLITLPGCTDR